MVELHLIHGEFSYQVIAWGLNNELDGTFLQVNLRVTNAQNMFLLNSYDTYKPKHFTKNNIILCALWVIKTLCFAF